MLARLMVKSLRNGKRRLAVASAAVLLAATLVAALSTLSLEVKSKAGRELEAYGPNLLLTPRGASLPAGSAAVVADSAGIGAYIPADSLDVLSHEENIRAWVPYSYALATVEGRSTVVAGTLFDQVRVLSPYWQVRGEWPEHSSAASSVLLGKRVADNLGLEPGSVATLDLGFGPVSMAVAGVVEVGGSEDNQVLLDLAAMQELARRPGQVDLVQVRAAADKLPLSAMSSQLEHSIPGIEVKVLGQIAAAEEKVLSRIQLILSMIAAFVLLCAGLTLFSTISASVLERTREVGLMKALGAGNRRIVLLFMSEAWSAGLMGAAAGSVLGIGLAQSIGRTVFNSGLKVHLEAVPLTFAAALLVATLASLWPVRNAARVQPIYALKGE